MATYVIGDIHGCYGALRRLLTQLRFDPAADHIWLVGDLVNRGPCSLEVLRWASSLGSSLVSVLGNHDLHLLARHLGVVQAKPKDDLMPVLQAPDRDRLLDWLRRQPLAWSQKGYLMIHAGLLPDWTIERVLALSGEISAMLQGVEAADLLEAVMRDRASERTARFDQAGPSQALRVLTQLRALNIKARPAPSFVGPLDQLPPGLIPWFRFPARRTASANVIFGHWAALDFHREPGVVALDSNCVRGGMLTAFRLEDERVFQEPGP
ncbi:MAG: symmetrical bis(5'-nucleosyl)-tetraphosphatase [Acidobacteriota bacterium]